MKTLLLTIALLLSGSLMGQEESAAQTSTSTIEEGVVKEGMPFNQAMKAVKSWGMIRRVLTFHKTVDSNNMMITFENYAVLSFEQGKDGNYFTTLIINPINN